MSDANPHTRYADYQGYIKKPQLVDGGLYVICARQAYVGLWSKEDDGFVIARCKFGRWYLFVEYHWDDKCYFEGKLANQGTAMPLRMIGCLIKNDEKGMIEFLQQLERDNPIIDGWDSIKDRDDSGKKYARELVQRRNNKRKLPVYKVIE